MRPEMLLVVTSRYRDPVLMRDAAAVGASFVLKPMTSEDLIGTLHSAYGEIARKQTDNEGRAVYPPVRSTINGVWDTRFVPQNARKQPVPKGAWVFSREE